MNIGEKINANAGRIMLAILAWIVIYGILLKAYNGFVYSINYHGSWSKIWDSPLFSLNYFQDYWANPFNIVINLFFILPPILGAILLWHGFHVGSKETEMQNQRLVDDFMQKLQPKRKKVSEPKFKKVKKKGKTKMVKI